VRGRQKRPFVCFELETSGEVASASDCNIKARITLGFFTNLILRDRFAIHKAIALASLLKIVEGAR